MDKEEKILKYLNRELSPEELQEFEKTEDFKLLNKIDHHLENLQEPDYNIEDGLNKLHERLGTETKSTTFSWYQIAASVVIIALACFYFLYNPAVVYRSHKGEQLAFYLPDSSIVRLNANSKITYSEEDWVAHRKLNLDGEAYFEVKPGSRFSVIGNKGTVTVLGTRFNVNDRKNYLIVDCFEGRVRVSSTKFKEELSAFQSVRWVDNTQEKIELNEQIAPWVNHRSKFKDVPLAVILEDLENQFDIKVALTGGDGNSNMTLSYDHNNLETALEIVSKPLNSTFIKTGKNEYQLTLEN